MKTSSCSTARRLFAGAAVLTATLSFAASALAGQGEFDRIVAFGDSLMDSGNAFVLTGDVATPPFDPVPSAAYAIGGHHFSNGKTWVEELGRELGVQRSTGPSARNAAIFSNYAVGGSRAREYGQGVSAAQQVAWYLGANIPSADTLYVFGFGSNDVRDALAAGPQDGPPILGQAIGAIAGNLLALCQSGARHILVPNIANIGTTPFAQAFGEPVISSATFVSASFNNGVALAITNFVQPQCPATTFYSLDLFSLSTAVFGYPAGFGFVDTAPCLEFYTTGGAICSNPNQRFFWDGIHPTRAGHQIIAAEALRVLGAP